MADNIDNIIIEHLKAIRAGQERIEFEVKEVKSRLTHLEATVIGGKRDTVSVQEDMYRVQGTIDRITDRLGRIENLLQHSTV